MVREEVLALEDNKLRAEVAQRIMGIKVEYPFGAGYPYYLEEGGMKWAPIPNYPADILAAWQVVVKMEELGFYFKLDSWQVEFYASGSDISKNTVKFDGLTPELVCPAICKAALLVRLV